MAPRREHDIRDGDAKVCLPDLNHRRHPTRCGLFPHGTASCMNAEVGAVGFDVLGSAFRPQQPRAQSRNCVMRVRLHIQVLSVALTFPCLTACEVDRRVATASGAGSAPVTSSPDPGDCLARPPPLREFSGHSDADLWRAVTHFTMCVSDPKVAYVGERAALVELSTRGSAKAAYNLSTLCRYGPDKDQKLARYYAKLALERGHPWAESAIQSLDRENAATSGGM